MTRERLKKLLPVMQAYADGGSIQFRNSLSDGWVDSNQPDWVLSCEYRIKPESTIVPFTWEDRELFRDKWFRSKSSRVETKITSINMHQIWMSGINISFEDLMKYYEFLDGTPCGKVVED